MKYSIFARVIAGKISGTVICLTRITFSPKTGNTPFWMHGRHFPICHAYAMTFNKSPGQLFDDVGIPWTVFSYGQLYVVITSLRKKENI